MKSILHPAFRYVPASQTDIRKTFARIRKELAQKVEVQKVTPIKRKKVAA